MNLPPSQICAKDQKGAGWVAIGQGRMQPDAGRIAFEEWNSSEMFFFAKKKWLAPKIGRILQHCQKSHEPTRLSTPNSSFPFFLLEAFDNKQLGDATKKSPHF